ncbi:uncharacterized protein LOC119190110 [Manduca sexta]|uniref:uncharacterized protein LOC119190110 n=1 Tax=Manduca sexta TaxID=7130 RepID=UPI0018902E64|nr:uncharacterized protein LOC119190110 [Manduca sexta]
MASTIHWIPTTSDDTSHLASIAVVGGEENYCNDKQALWVIRAQYEGDLIPGVLDTKRDTAYVPWNGEAHAVKDIEVCCASHDEIQWIPAGDGEVPPLAVPGGKTASGETLYIGRAWEQNSLIPGKIQPSLGHLYLPFKGKEVAKKYYEVLCTVH